MATAIDQKIKTGRNKVTTVDYFTVEDIILVTKIAKKKSNKTISKSTTAPQVLFDALLPQWEQQILETANKGRSHTKLIIGTRNNKQTEKLLTSVLCLAMSYFTDKGFVCKCVHSNTESQYFFNDKYYLAIAWIEKDVS